MAQVAMALRIMPESLESFDSMKKAIVDQYKPRTVKEEPIGFGLKALKITLVLEDVAGTADIDEKIKKIAGVGEVEVEMVTRL